MPDTEAAVTPWDFRHPEEIDRAGVLAIRGMAESFARSGGGRIGALLRNRTQVHLESLDQLDWGDFEADLAGPSLLGSFELRGAGSGTAVIHLPIDLAMTAIDLQLAGSGVGPLPLRALSDMERQIIAPLLEVIAQEVAASTSAVLGHVEASPVTQIVIAASHARDRGEQCVILRFSVRLAQVAQTSWGLDVCIPTSALRPLVERSGGGGARHEAAVSPAMEKAVKALPVTVSLRFAMTAIPLSVAESLCVDQVISLGHQVGSPLLVYAQDRPLFNADLVATGKRAACQVVAYLDPEE